MATYDEWLKAPLRIDTSQPYPEAVSLRGRRDYLGGLRWSGPFQRHMAGVVPVGVAEVRRLRHEYWDHPYIVNRLTAHLGEESMNALLAWWRDDVDYGTANRMTRKGRRNPGHLEVQDRKARRIVKTLLLPDDRPLDDDPEEDE